MSTATAAPSVKSRLVMKVAAISVLCALVVGCAPAPLSGDLRSARELGNREYPRRVGNYLPHAQCVNEAVERYALPTASHPDLIRLQEGREQLYPARSTAVKSACRLGSAAWR